MKIGVWQVCEFLKTSDSLAAPWNSRSLPRCVVLIEKRNYSCAAPWRKLYGCPPLMQILSLWHWKVEFQWKMRYLSCSRVKIHRSWFWKISHQYITVLNAHTVTESVSLWKFCCGIVRWRFTVWTVSVYFWNCGDDVVNQSFLRGLETALGNSVKGFPDKKQTGTVKTYLFTDLYLFVSKWVEWILFQLFIMKGCKLCRMRKTLSTVVHIVLR